MRNGNYMIKFSRQAEKDKKKLRSSELDKACKEILSLMARDPFCYLPFYEKLCGELSDLYSKRINWQHRIVYEVDENKKEIHIIRMWTHYDKI